MARIGPPTTPQTPQSPEPAPGDPRGPASGAPAAPDPAPDDDARDRARAALGGPPRGEASDVQTQPVAAALALGADPRARTRYPAEVQIGRAYRDAAGFGSFVSPAPAGRLEAPADLGVRLAPALDLDLSAAARPHVEVLVTSSKALKWRPALDFVVQALAARIPGLSADDVLQRIAADGLDPDAPMSISGAHLTLSTFKVDSGVPEQPIGLAEGLRGAIQRTQRPEKGAAESTIQARLADAAADGRVALVVSMENFFGLEPLDPSAMPKAWRRDHAVTPEAYVGGRGRPNLAYLDDQGRVAVDRAAIFVDLAAGGRRQQAAVLSDGVAAPMAYLDAARATGQDVTAGKFMSGDATAEGLAPLGVSHDKWHGELVPGADRNQILADAVHRIPLRVR